MNLSIIENLQKKKNRGTRGEKNASEAVGWGTKVLG